MADHATGADPGDRHCRVCPEPGGARRASVAEPDGTTRVGV